MGLAGTLRTQSIADAVLAGNTEEALAQFESLWQDGKDPAALLGELSGLFRDALLLRLAPKGGRTLISGAYGENVLRDIRAGDGNLLWLLNTLQKHQALLRETGNPRLQTELCLAELSGGGEIAPPRAAAPCRDPPRPGRNSGISQRRLRRRRYRKRRLRRRAIPYMRRRSRRVSLSRQKKQNRRLRRRKASR